MAKVIRVDDEVYNAILEAKQEYERLVGQPSSMNEGLRFALQTLGLLEKSG